MNKQMRIEAIKAGFSLSDKGISKTPGAKVEDPKLAKSLQALVNKVEKQAVSEA